MLILAGVSINAVVGDNGVLTKAKEASIASKKASILEELNLKLAGYNINTLTDKDVGTKQILTELMSEGYIDTVLNSGGDYVSDTNAILPVPRFDENNNYTGEFAYGVKKDDYAINIYTANDGIYKADYGEISFSSGGSVQAGTVLVTKDSFNSSDDVAEEDKGKYSIDSDSNIIFIDTIEGELSFYIKSGVHAKINIFNDMTLTNEGLKRSAIDIEPGGILDLYVAEGATLTVDSGYGEKGEDNIGEGAKGGPGGYAGIHVPKNGTGIAELNLMGSGTLISYGGNAGDGGSAIGGNNGGAGGGGAGAGIGGNGGRGGDGNWDTENFHKRVLLCSGGEGESGESCGNVNIYNSIIVYAYGGAGGSGGEYNNASSGTGGGGYPAAGIGGGGAGAGGGDHINGAGGYSGGVGQCISVGNLIVNGGDQKEPEEYAMTVSGGSYFQAHRYDGRIGGLYPETDGGKIGGQGGTGFGYGYWTDTAGDGGVAGNGGTVKVSSNSKVYSYNGNRYTDGVTGHEYNKNTAMSNQCPIYAQNGILRDVYKINTYWNEREYYNFEYFKEIFGNTVNSDILNIETAIESSMFKNSLVRPATTCSKTGYMNPSNTSVIYGIGSGAGYIELSNGTYTVDASMN